MDFRAFQKQKSQTWSDWIYTRITSNHQDIGLVDRFCLKSSRIVSNEEWECPECATLWSVSSFFGVYYSFHFDRWFSINAHLQPIEKLKIKENHSKWAFRHPLKFQPFETHQYSLVLRIDRKSIRTSPRMARRSTIKFKLVAYNNLENSLNSYP